MASSLSRIAALLLAAVWAIAPEGLAAEEPGAVAAEVLDMSGVEGGLVVHVGCGDGRLTAALRESPAFVVQGLCRDSGRLDEARRNILGMGASGAVSVLLLADAGRLPYTDNLVSLLVVEEQGAIDRGEMLRVLRPGGVACLRTDSGWERFEKPWPDNIDEWTHYLHTADNNAVAHDRVVGPPRHMQWVGAPEWTRYHHTLNSISSAVTAAARLFYIVDQSTSANMNVPGKWEIVARDAFNGVFLWRKPMASWAWHQIRFRSGPAQLPRLLVVAGDRLYAPLGLDAPVSEMDAASGRTLRVFEETDSAEEIIVCGDVLLALTGAPVAEQAVGHEAFVDRYGVPNCKSVVAVDLPSGETIWSFSPEGNPMPETLAADGERAYLQVDQTVRCLSLESGEPIWMFARTQEETPRKNIRFGGNLLVVSDGVVLCKLGDRLQAISAKTGDALWDCAGGLGFHAPMDVFVIDGLVWRGIHPRDSISPPPVDDFGESLDLLTGETVATNAIAVDLQTAGHHHRCYREKATDRYIIMGKRGVEMMDLAGDEHSRNNWVRGTCQYGILPANGLIYAPSHSCGCYMESKLRGFWALASERPAVEDAAKRVQGNARLTKGPAFGESSKRNGPQTADWPTFRGDALRSGVTDASLPEDLAVAWRAAPGGRLTQPVVSEGVVVLAAVDDHTVHAFDQVTGERRWHFAAGGRIDSPPSFHNGTVIFGCADGHVYCLRLKDGALVWDFFAAQGAMNAVARDQVESLWPVHGSVLLMGDAVYLSSGRSTWLDGGIDLYALDSETGKVLHHSRYESRQPVIGEAGKKDVEGDFDERIAQNLTDRRTYLEPDLSDAFSMAGGSVSDVLVTDGYDIYLHQARFSPQLERREALSRHLFSTSSLLDDSENHRSHWVLGTGDFSKVPIAYSWIANGRNPNRNLPTNIAVPTGVTMVYDENALWVIRRKGGASGKYILAKEGNRPFSPDEESLPDFRKIRPEEWETPAWQTDLDMRATAMLKAGPRLYIAATSTDVPEEDPYAAYEGRMGAALRVYSSENGSLLDELPLEQPAVWDGMAATDGHLFISCTDGRLLCLRKAERADGRETRETTAENNTRAPQPRPGADAGQSTAALSKASGSAASGVRREKAFPLVQ